MYDPKAAEEIAALKAVVNEMHTRVQRLEYRVADLQEECAALREQVPDNR